MKTSACQLRKRVVLQSTFIVDCSFFIYIFKTSLFFVSMYDLGKNSFMKVQAEKKRLQKT